MPNLTCRTTDMPVFSFIPSTVLSSGGAPEVCRSATDDEIQRISSATYPNGSGKRSLRYFQAKCTNMDNTTRRLCGSELSCSEMSDDVRLFGPNWVDVRVLIGARCYHPGSGSSELLTYPIIKYNHIIIKYVRQLHILLNMCLIGTFIAFIPNLCHG